MIKKNEILQVAKKLFNEKGYSHVSMRDISEELHISVGNLTYHYAKKQDLLQAIMRDALPGLLPNITDLKSLNLFLLHLIESLESQRFYFAEYNQMSQWDIEGTQNIASITACFHEGLNHLRKQKMFNELFTDAVQNSLIQFVMYSHLAWIHEPVRDMASFLDMHWTLFYPFLSEAGKREYMKEIKQA